MSRPDRHMCPDRIRKLTGPWPGLTGPPPMSHLAGSRPMQLSAPVFNRAQAASPPPPQLVAASSASSALCAASDRPDAVLPDGVRPASSAGSGSVSRLRGDGGIGGARRAQRDRSWPLRRERSDADAGVPEGTRDTC
mmetsp:Transcript_15716/g.46408  ORF Transcript_15716/g.46408 Transcript_15716/m.46408 type:complete len:137 (+) Transcript_15716:827-1237(+)